MMEMSKYSSHQNQRRKSAPLFSVAPTWIMIARWEGPEAVSDSTEGFFYGVDHQGVLSGKRTDIFKEIPWNQCSQTRLNPMMQYSREQS